MLALHQIRTTRRPSAAAPRAPAPGALGFTSPAEVARFASGMAEKGSTPEGIAWFLGGDS